MDSIPVTTTDGLIAAYATANNKRRSEAYSLRNYLKKCFELYETMKIDHTVSFGDYSVTYAASSKRFHILWKGNHQRDFRKLTDVAWELHRCGIRNPNARSDWIEV